MAFFERQRGWTGFCVEPNRVNFELVKKNRKCFPINSALCAVDGKVTFMELAKPHDQVNILCLTLTYFIVLYECLLLCRSQE